MKNSLVNKYTTAVLRILKQKLAIFNELNYFKVPQQHACKFKLVASITAGDKDLEKTSK